MPNFRTAEELVAYRVTCERVDEGGVTRWQVVDRFNVPPMPEVVAVLDDEDGARAQRDAIRAMRVPEAKRMNRQAV